MKKDKLGRKRHPSQDAALEEWLEPRRAAPGMVSWKVRVHVSPAEQELVLGLTPAERGRALVEAAKRK